MRGGTQRTHNTQHTAENVLIVRQMLHGLCSLLDSVYEIIADLTASFKFKGLDDWIEICRCADQSNHCQRALTKRFLSECCKCSDLCIMDRNEQND